MVSVLLFFTTSQNDTSSFYLTFILVVEHVREQGNKNAFA